MAIPELSLDAQRHILADLLVNDAANVVENSRAFHGFDDWCSVMARKYPDITWSDGLSRSNAILADQTLTDPCHIKYSRVLQRGLVTVAVVAAAKLGIKRATVMRDAAHDGQHKLATKILKNLLADPDSLTTTDVETLFLVAGLQGDIPVMKTLVDRHGVDPELKYNRAVVEAIYGNRLDVVKYLVSLDSKDANKRDNYAFSTAYARGRLGIVKYLASLESVDPGADDNDAFVRASWENRPDVVKYLASLDSVDPSAQDNEAIIAAAVNKGLIEEINYDNNSLAVVKYLASLDSVDPFAQNNAALSAAREYDNAGVVEFLSSLGAE